MTIQPEPDFFGNVNGPRHRAGPSDDVARLGIVERRL
jgi:hypothetical protein